MLDLLYNLIQIQYYHESNYDPYLMFSLSYSYFLNYIFQSINCFEYSFKDFCNLYKYFK